MRVNFFIILFLFCSSCIFSRGRSLTIDQAIKLKAAKVKVNRVIGYSGKCLSLSVLNLTDDSLYLLVTPGWVFDSDDSTKQDLMVIKEFMFAMDGGQSKLGDIFANCCQMKKLSPTGSKFSKTKTAKLELRSLAEFLNENDYPSNVVCNAVWAISDNQPISSICGSGSEKDQELRKKVSELMKKELPWYSVITETKEHEDGRIESLQKSLFGEFTCNIAKGTEFTIKLTDRKGREIMMLQPKLKAKDNLQNYYVEFSVENLPKKEFFITFTNNRGKDIIKKSVDLSS
ncbi:MAG: hypothetical protein ACK452_00400 [Bacteroidota bacterium]|jgi:hypothetical protein